MSFNTAIENKTEVIFTKVKRKYHFSFFFPFTRANNLCGGLEDRIKERTHSVNGTDKKPRVGQGSIPLRFAQHRPEADALTLWAMGSLTFVDRIAFPLITSSSHSKRHGRFSSTTNKVSFWFFTTYVNYETANVQGKLNEIKRGRFHSRTVCILNTQTITKSQ